MSNLVARYRANYGIPDSQTLSEEQVRHHFELEKRLTEQLLSSAPDARRATFERCYDELYSALPWLNSGDPARSVGIWPFLLGPPPRSIYEVGSGQGGLARALADHGYSVTATEITQERGARREERPRLRWEVTDGAHLDRFADVESYDAILSNQVIEHLHPDDLEAHLKGALRLLKPGGRYAICTPHAYEGPSDISLVFDEERPVGMHLREYTYRELAEAARMAGFSRSAVPFGLPARLRTKSPVARGVRPSPAYLRYLRLIERLVGPIAPQRRRRAVVRALKAPLFTRGLTIVAYK